MMFSGSQSYYDQYVHKNGLGKMVLEQSAARKPTLLTDRGAYLNYLEVQLERVSSACLTVQAYDERCNDLQGLLLSLDQKIQNLSKVVAATLEQNVTCSVDMHSFVYISLMIIVIVGSV